MATLGAALGMTVTAAAANHASAKGVTVAGAEDAAIGMGIGAGVWLILSAAVVGLSAGLVLAKTSDADRAYAPNVHGLVTWACGITVAALFAATGASGLASAAGAAAAQVPNAVRATEGIAANDANGRSTDGKPVDAALGRHVTELTPERAAAIDAAKAAAAAAATAAWVALVAQCLGLGATLWAANRRPLQVAMARVQLQTA